MPAPFNVMVLYRDGQRIISGRPGNDDPRAWARKMKADAILNSNRVNITVRDRDDQPWTMAIVNLGTAAHAGWIKDRRLHAVVLALTGADDVADLKAAAQAERAARLILPPGVFGEARTHLSRPAVLLTCIDKPTFTNRMIATLSVALATALFEKADANESKPPLRAPTPRIKGPNFLSNMFNPDGSVGAERTVELAELKENPDSARLTEFFEARFQGEGGNSFDAVVSIGNGPKLSVQWQAFGSTAGVVTVGQSGDEVVEIALLLTGLEVSADDAATAAYEAYIARTGVSGAWPMAFRHIANADRPLLVRFKVGTTSEQYERVQWVVAAAFFDRNGVL